MKIDALILAGGIGSRMGGNTPKQFLEIGGVPIIVRTILNFERNNRISEIAVVCVAGYEHVLKRLVEKFGLKKVKHIFTGGSTGHDSVRNGLYGLKDILSDGDYIIIHDAVRPILPQLILNEMIDTALKKGNACLAVPCYETVICTSDGLCGNKEIDRDSFVRVQTPQMYSYKALLKLYERADCENRHDFVYANTLAVYYGMTIFFSKGFNYNFKITTPDDLPLYSALLNFSDEELSRR